MYLSNKTLLVLEDSYILAGGPGITWWCTVHDHYHVSQLKVWINFWTLLSSMKLWKVLSYPSFPKQIGDILNWFPSPPSLVVLLCQFTRGHCWLSLQKQKRVWGESLQVIGVRWSYSNGATVKDGFNFTEHSVETFFIKILSVQGGTQNFPHWSDLSFPYSSMVWACGRIKYPVDSLLEKRLVFLMLIPTFYTIFELPFSSNIPLSNLNTFTCLRLAMKRQRALFKESVSRDEAISRWIALEGKYGTISFYNTSSPPRDMCS